jgi:pimeloyl-ACP methyl ester carboxylesterase
MANNNTTTKTEAQAAPKNYYGRSLQAAFALAQLVPPLALRLAHRLFYVPRKSTRPPFAPPGFEKSFVDAGGYSICVYSIGEGRPVLLIHGWELGVYRFEALMKKIAAAGFRVVAFDIPGHGESSGKQCDIVEICKVAIELDKRFGPFFAGVAHSYGGLCLANLLRIGLKMRKVVLFATPVTYESIIDRFGEFLHLRPRLLASLRVMINQRYVPHRLEEDFSTLKNLRETETSTLLVHDETDSVVPFADASALAQAHANIQLVSTNGLGHNRIVSSPEVISSCIAFLTAESKEPVPVGGNAR